MTDQTKHPLKGWRLAGTDKWWPAMYGSPPWDAAGGWEPIYEDESTGPAVYAAPQGAINEAISMLDTVGRPDLGTAVKRLWELCAPRWREQAITETVDD